MFASSFGNSPKLQAKEDSISPTQLKRTGANANVQLDARGLTPFSFGNASVVDREAGVIGIKASGIGCRETREDNVVLIALRDGEIVEGKLNPSVDAPTHRMLYQRFPELGSIVHTHSPSATAWAQALNPIPCLGTTHADYFNGAIPVTRSLRADETASDYETNTAVAIIETIEKEGGNPLQIPGILVASHGPFTWGENAEEAVSNAVVLENIAGMAAWTLLLSPDIGELSTHLRSVHFNRKHGLTAYYGQR